MGAPAAVETKGERRARSEREQADATRRRARLFGCSARDPLLRTLRRQLRKQKATAATARPAPDKLPADLHERLYARRQQPKPPRPIIGREGHFYAGNSQVPPGSMKGAAFRYGGRGAHIVVRRSADRTNKGVPAVTAFEAASVSLLANEWAPPLRNETLGYVAGPSTPFSCRCWPAEARFPGAGAFAKDVIKETFRGSEFYSSQTTAVLAEVGRRAKERARRRRARPQSASMASVLLPRGPTDVDPRARRQHRQTKTTHDGYSAQPSRRQPVLTRPASAPAARRPLTNTEGLHIYRQSGKNLILEQNETRDEVIRRVHLQRFRQDGRRAQLKWSALKAFLRACELHFLSDRAAVDAGAEAPLLTRVAGLFGPVVSRGGFQKAIAGLNIPRYLFEALWANFSDGKRLDATGLLLALRLLADAHPAPSAREPLEAKVPGLLEIGIQNLVKVFSVASKSDEERHEVQMLFELRLRPVLNELMAQSDQVVPTAEIVTDALGRCPELLEELKAQASHESIVKNAVKTDLGRVRSAQAIEKFASVVFEEDEEDKSGVIQDDEYVDVDGVVRPKGLGVHNSLINWTNKPVPRHSEM